MKNVVLIGSGNRAQSVIIPALWSVRDEFQILGVISRTEKELNLFDGAFRMKTQTSYDSIDWSKIDIVIVAVTLDAVPDVVKKLIQATSYPPRVEERQRVEAGKLQATSLLIDTPVLPLQKLRTLKSLKRFKHVQVSEDTMGLPPFVAARKIIDQGLIGKVKRIWMFHSGYRYHALASLKWITRSSYIRFARMRKWNRNVGVKEVQLSSGASATIVEPRDYSIGRFLIVGEKGSIGDYPIEKSENHYVVERGDMTKMKIHGFVTLLHSLDDSNSSYRYSPIDGVYDAFVIAMLEKTGYFFDLSLFGKSFVKRILGIL